MPTDSTRNNIVEKILGLHYNDFQNSAPCIDSAFTSIGSQKSPIIGSSWESRARAHSRSDLWLSGSMPAQCPVRRRVLRPNLQRGLGLRGRFGRHVRPSRSADG